MKKLFLLTILMAGLFVNADSQNLNYVVYNASSSVWDFKMADTAGNEAEELSITPLSSCFFHFAKIVKEPFFWLKGVALLSKMNFCFDATFYHWSNHFLLNCRINKILSLYLFYNLVTNVGFG